mmetsp:Transcript_493/g.847  ORF Transcript_493/g.847 Transcript_493/m.847 type:complete len:512 (+) Transcript_493:238-1773(+)
MEANEFFSGKNRGWDDDGDGEGQDDDYGEVDVGDDDGLDDDGGRQLEDGGDIGETYVDIVLFHEPPECANTRLGCDWTELGVGASDGVGNVRWCCSDDATALGLCRGGPKQDGRLIVDPDKFKGQHTFLGVPPSGDWRTNVKRGRFDLKERVDGSGKYALVVANCNDLFGRNLTITGQYTWKSVHGYLPGNLFGEMYFFFGLMVFYLILFVWYAFMMNYYRDEIIPIQKWVLSTIGIGLLESFFKAGDLWVWNVDGERFWFSLYTGVVFGVLKRAISRCLVVMLSLGWGVTCDSLGSKMRKVVLLGIIYAGCSAARDIFTVMAITENEILSQDQENEILDVVTILTFVVSFIDVTFYLWIFDALNGTMQYLEGMNQAMKLKRYLRLRLILLISVLFAILWSVFGIVDSYNDKRMVNEEENGWVLSAVWEINYLFVLIGLSYLWAPETGAKEYAYVMELSPVGGDLEFDTNIGSPDDDDNDGEEGVSSEYSDSKPGGYSDEDELHIDKGVKA